jgi:hypothetical protein
MTKYLPVGIDFTKSMLVRLIQEAQGTTSRGNGPLLYVSQLFCVVEQKAKWSCNSTLEISLRQPWGRCKNEIPVKCSSGK